MTKDWALAGRGTWAVWAAALFAGVGASSASADAPRVGDPYPLDRCMVRGDGIPADAPAVVDQGQEIRVCCDMCEDEYWGKDAAVQEKIRRAIVKQQLGRYPLEKCIVSGKPLGNSAKNVVLYNRLFRLCCSDCREKLRDRPWFYFGKLDRAVIADQKPTYPLERSVVSGKPLGKDAVDHVIANRLIRLANPDEVKKLDEMPAKYLARVEQARRGKTIR